MTRHDKESRRQELHVGNGTPPTGERQGQSLGGAGPFRSQTRAVKPARRRAVSSHRHSRDAWRHNTVRRSRFGVPAARRSFPTPRLDSASFARRAGSGCSILGIKRLPPRKEPPCLEGPHPLPPLVGPCRGLCQPSGNLEPQPETSVLPWSEAGHPAAARGGKEAEMPAIDCTGPSATRRRPECANPGPAFADPVYHQL